MSETAFVFLFWGLIGWLAICTLAIIEYIGDKMAKKRRKAHAEKTAAKYIKAA